jgi:hypothetical protein
MPLLDVGLSIPELETWLEQNPQNAIVPLFQYALAVRYARNQDYARALQIATDLDLTQMSPPVLGSYYTRIRTGWVNSQETSPPQTVLQQQMQALLTEQRQRWQRLQQLQAEGTSTARYTIAADWASEGGWKNGYLGLWTESRITLLPTGNWSNESCRQYWICNLSLRSPEAVQSSYRQASQNAIALSLYQQLLKDPQTPAQLREKALYMSAATVLWQWENHPLGETMRIHPLAGMDTTVTTPEPDSQDPDANYQTWQSQYQRLEQDYLNYLDKAIAALKQAFPQSIYIDDLLFARYAMSGQPQALEEIVERYSTGDRAAEAKFLLLHRQENESN